MAESKSTYTRLPGRTLGVFQRGSIWLGPDHLLLVHETMTGEEYRRFFFRDIKSVVIRGTTRRGSVNGLMLGLAALNLLPLFALASADPDDRSIAWIAAGAAVWAVLALVNTLRGPTCETRIRTAVQDDVVPPLRRQRTARRVLDTVRTHILAAQAAAPAETATP